jgi:hypothetical protein
MPMYQITVPGYEYNSNGADYHPDAFEEFEGTQEELIEHILKHEAAYQEIRELRRYEPGGFSRFAKEHLKAHPDVWAALGFIRDEAPCDEWFRGVVEVRQVELDTETLLRQAEALGMQRAKDRIAAAETKVAVADSLAIQKREEHERVEFERLSKKFQGRVP